MRVLLDENLPKKFAAYLEGHECRSVVECGWLGKRNGELLALADPVFDVLLTLDRNLPYQQNLHSRRIALVVVRARSSRMVDLLPQLPACLAALRTILPGQVVRIDLPTLR
jgi:hypothetical protein